MDSKTLEDKMTKETIITEAKSLFSTKTIILVIVGSLILMSCSSVKETTTTTTTQRDSTVAPPVIDGTVDADNENNAFQEWAYGTINYQRGLIDSLRRQTGDTVYLDAKLPPLKPFIYEAEGSTVTQNGDSVKVSFKKESNKKGQFTFKIVPAKVTVTINDTHTTETKEYQPPWYEKVWNKFKVFISVLIAFGIGIVVGSFLPNIRSRFGI